MIGHRVSAVVVVAILLARCGVAAQTHNSSTPAQDRCCADSPAPMQVIKSILFNCSPKHGCAAAVRQMQQAGAAAAAAPEAAGAEPMAADDAPAPTAAAAAATAPQAAEAAAAAAAAEAPDAPEVPAATEAGDAAAPMET